MSLKPNNLPTASKTSQLIIVLYILLAAIKLLAANVVHSPALYADGLNNLTDIISNLSLSVGLYLAKKPADKNHQYGHERFETLASFTVSLIMFTVGFDLLRSGWQTLRLGDFSGQASPIGLIASLGSAIVLVLVQKYVQAIAKKTQSLALKAASKDLMNDSLASFGTAIALLATGWGYPIVDVLVSIVIALVIIYSAIELFMESSFLLSDGFDQEEIQKYYHTTLAQTGVRRVSTVHGRLIGNDIHLDITIEVDPKLTVLESHAITQVIEKVLKDQYQVNRCDIHVEPYLGD